MKRFMAILFLALLFSYTLYTNAKEGSVEIISKIEGDNYFSFVKVADIIQGNYVLTEEYESCGADLNYVENARDMREVIELLQSQEVTTKKEIKTSGERVVISDLEEGVYLIENSNINNYQVSSMLISVPMYDEKTGEMIYDITVIPKSEFIMESVQTRDENQGLLLLILVGISFLIIIAFACHWYLECVRIKHKKKHV